MREDITYWVVVPKLKIMRAPGFVFTSAHAMQCELAAETLRASGRLRLGVTGWSMLPTLWPGDTLVIEQADSDAVSAGDIVLFARDRRFFVHRIVEKRACDRQIQTRGDAMRHMDAPVSNSELLGRVVSVERNGRSITPIPALNAGNRSMAVLLRQSQMATRVVVAMREALQTL